MLRHVRRHSPGATAAFRGRPACGAPSCARRVVSRPTVPGRTGDYGPGDGRADLRRDRGWRGRLHPHASRHRVSGGGCGPRRDGRKAASAPTVSNATLPSNTPPTRHPPADPADSARRTIRSALHPVIAEKPPPAQIGGSGRVLAELLDHAVSCGLAVVGYATGRGRSRSALNNGVHALAACASLFRRVHDSCDLAKQLRQIR